MDKRLTAEIKEYARELGADLVGVANIERFAKAPVKMSPQGILPTAKSVVVCAIHHPDATIEREGGEHGKSQQFDSYTVQYTMNSKLDHISYRIGRFIDSKGYAAVPIVSSNIWRYRSYKELDAVFSPDMSHIYASVAAGLSEMGWNGLALTPEYGPRNRFISIITDAELEPTPLYDGPKLCDMCGECIRCCPTDAYRKQVNGVKTIEIEDKTYKFANKNLWRCAWGEHFDLDLDDVIPDVVDEDAILKRMAEKGRRGGEMGVCLKVCVPPALRFRDESYTQYNRRRRTNAPADLPVSREAFGIMNEIALRYHADRITTVSADKFAGTGVDLESKLPGAKSVIFLSSSYKPSALPASAKWRTEGPITSALRNGLNFAGYDIARELEKWGYDTMPSMNSLRPQGPKLVPQALREGESTLFEAILTNAPLPERDIDLRSGSHIVGDLKRGLYEIAKQYGVDLMGVAPASRVEDIKRQLTPIKDGEKLFNVRDKNGAFKVFDPEVSETKRELLSPEQYVPGAKSVIVLASRYPASAASRAGQPPAEAIGPFIFAQSQGLNELNFAGAELIAALRAEGYSAHMTHDLLGAGTLIATPRGNYASPFDSVLEAVAAGLGQLTYGGYLYTDEFGVTQKLLCIVTDAPLPADPVKHNTIQRSSCDDCRVCISECPMKAYKFDSRTTLTVDGETFDYVPVDSLHCQWASRYTLTNRDGFKYLGYQLDEMPPEGEDITADMIASALRKRDPVTKYRPAAAEQCFVHCPLIK